MSSISVRLIFLVGVAIASAVGAQVYKWVDKNGMVHYGDCPPTECESQEVQLAPEPSREAIRETQDRMQHIQQYEQQIRKPKKITAETKKERQDGRSTTRIPVDRRCFSLLEDAWEGRVSDSREPPVHKPLDDAQIDALKSLFDEIAGQSKGNLGRYSGTMVETKCLTPKSSPPMKVYHYDVNWDGDWKSDQIFRIEASMVGREQKSHYKTFYWFLVSPGGLRFSNNTTDATFNLDRARYDVGVLQASDGRLVLYWRGGGRLKKTTMIALEVAERGFSLNEYFYVQGTLARFRSWEIGG